MLLVAALLVSCSVLHQVSGEGPISALPKPHDEGETSQVSGLKPMMTSGNEGISKHDTDDDVKPSPISTDDSETRNERADKDTNSTSLIEGKNLGAGYVGAVGVRYVAAPNTYHTGYVAPVYNSGGQNVHNNGVYLHRQIPAAIRLPHIDRNGCRFVGEPVCNPEMHPYGISYCALTSENKSLWRRPLFTVFKVGCPGGPGRRQVRSDFCNNTKRLLKAMGLVKSYDEPFLFNHLKRKFAYVLDPCILIGNVVLGK